MKIEIDDKHIAKVWTLHQLAEELKEAYALQGDARAKVLAPKTEGNDSDEPVIFAEFGDSRLPPPEYSIYLCTLDNVCQWLDTAHAVIGTDLDTNETVLIGFGQYKDVWFEDEKKLN